MNRHDYTFPFDTCERVSLKGSIAQPFSFTVNVLSCIVLFIYTRILPVASPFQYVLYSLLLFESWHCLSHAHHVSFLHHRFPTIIVHFLSYLIMISLFYAFMTKTKKWPSFSWWIPFLLVCIFDLYAVSHLSFLWYFCSSLLLFLWIFVAYHDFVWATKRRRRLIIMLFLSILLLSFFFILEVYFCSFFIVKIPFHALIEFIGLIIFLILGQLFLVLS